MYIIVKTFLEKYNILSSCQYGFRSKKNTTDAIYNLSYYIAEHFDKGKILQAYLLMLVRLLIDYNSLVVY